MDASMILRNFLFKLLLHPSTDGFQVGIRIDDIERSEERNEIAEKLVDLGCLKPGWTGLGRDKIQGQFIYDKIEEVIKSGKIE